MEVKKDAKAMVVIWTRDVPGYDEEQYEDVLTFPARFQVCWRCAGRGTHDHPAFSNGITSSEWDGPDWDDDSRETYMRGGYDVRCEHCSGERLTLEIDEDACKLDTRLSDALDAFRDEAQREAQDEANDRHTRRMENGGHDY